MKRSEDKKYAGHLELLEVPRKARHEVLTAECLKAKLIPATVMVAVRCQWRIRRKARCERRCSVRVAYRGYPAASSRRHFVIGLCAQRVRDALVRIGRMVVGKKSAESLEELRSRTWLLFIRSGAGGSLTEARIKIVNHVFPRLLDYLVT